MENKSRFTEINVVCIGAFICCFLWGSAFPVIKLGYEAFGISNSDMFTQILFAGIRFVLAGILVVIIGSIPKRRIIVPQRASYSKVFKLSLLQTVAQYVFFYIGLARTTGVRASIVEGTNVFVAIIVAAIIFRQESLTTKKLVGCIVGFLGVVIVNLTGSVSTSGNFLFGDLLVFLSTVAYALSSVLLKEYSKAEDPVVLSGYQFIIGGLVMIAAGVALGGRISFVSNEVVTINTGRAIGILFYLACVSAVAYSLWGILMKHNPISRVAVFGFMNPVCGVILSAVLLDEGSGLGFIHIISLALVCAGIYIVNSESLSIR